MDCSQASRNLFGIEAPRHDEHVAIFRLAPIHRYYNAHARPAIGWLCGRIAELDPECEKPEPADVARVFADHGMEIRFKAA